LLLTAMLCHRPLPVNRIGQALLFFSPAYLLGMWFSHYRERVIRFVDARLALLFATFFAVELLCVFGLHREGALFSHTPFSFEGGWLDLNMPNKLLLSFALIGLLKRHQAAIGARLDYLAGASFGVFFLHVYVMQAAVRLSIRVRHHDIEASPVSVLVLVPLCTLVSLGVVAIVRAALGKRSRYVVGC
jgi:surface polysaccharide O-acyltransferase-like enzyme